MCHAQGPQRSEASEARTGGLSISSQALYRLVTALPDLFSLSATKNMLFEKYV